MRTVGGAPDDLPTQLSLGNQRGVVARALSSDDTLKNGFKKPKCSLQYYPYIVDSPFGQAFSQYNIGYWKMLPGFPIRRIWWKASRTDLVAIDMDFVGSPFGSIGPAGGSVGSQGAAYLDVGEFIVNATVGWWDKVNGIVFTTNTGRTIEVGAPRANWKKVTQASNSPTCANTTNQVLVGIVGKAAFGGFVEQIDLYWGPAMAATTPSNNAVFVRGTVSTTAPWSSKPFPDKQASVIWHSNNGAVPSTASSPPMPTFYKTFTPTASPGLLHVAAEKYAQVYVNGVPLGPFWGSNYNGSAAATVTLNPGVPNTIMVRCANTDTTVGLALSILWTKNTKKVIVRTDSSWRYYLNPAVSVLGNLTDATSSNSLTINPSDFSSQDAKYVWSPLPAAMDPGVLDFAYFTFETWHYNTGSDVNVTLDVFVPGRGGYTVLANGVRLPSDQLLDTRLLYNFTLRGAFTNVITMQAVNYGRTPGFVSALYVTSTREMLAVSDKATWTAVLHGTASW